MSFYRSWLVYLFGGVPSSQSAYCLIIVGLGSAAVGAEAGDDRIELLLSQVRGKAVTELVAAGREKLASVPAGGGVAVAATPAAAGAAAAPAAEAKKEEKVEEKEESDDDMGFSLFD